MKSIDEINEDKVEHCMEDLAKFYGEVYHKNTPTNVGVRGPALAEQILRHHRPAVLQAAFSQRERGRHKGTLLNWLYDKVEESKADPLSAVCEETQTRIATYEEVINECLRR